jgi:flagellar motor switch protein FliN
MNENEDLRGLAADWASALAEQLETGAAGARAPGEVPAPERPGADFRDSGSPTPGAVSEDVNLDLILDILVTISLEIGRTKVSIRDLLQFNQGSVVELDRLAGEPMDVLANGTLIARGEVVVVNEKFGIRLTDVVSQQERVKNLK